MRLEKEAHEHVHKMIEDEKRARQKEEDERKAAEERARFEKFKTDAKEKVNRAFGGINNDITYLRTAHGYYCCVFYNQGVTYTNVNLYYRHTNETGMVKKIFKEGEKLEPILSKKLLLKFQILLSHYNKKIFFEKKILILPPPPLTFFYFF